MVFIVGLPSVADVFDAFYPTAIIRWSANAWAASSDIRGVVGLILTCLLVVAAQTDFALGAFAATAEKIWADYADTR